MWFVESVVWPITFCGVGAALLYVAWLNNARPRYLVGIGGLAVLAIFFFFLEKYLVSDAELMGQNIPRLIEDFEAKEEKKVLEYFSPTLRDQVSLVVHGAIEDVTIQGKLNVIIERVEFKSQNSRAITRFRVNGTVGYREHPPRDFPTRWEFTWQKEAEEWKVIKVRRLNPVNGEQISVWE